MNREFCQKLCFLCELGAHGGGLLRGAPTPRNLSRRYDEERPAPILSSATGRGSEVTEENMAKVRKSDGQPRLKRKQYEKELRRLQAELCQLQDGSKRRVSDIMIVFEGRDGAGKGGTIQGNHGGA